MKNLSLVLGALLVSSAAMAGSLDGKSYCRTYKSDGMFGQPVRETKHCIIFENDKAIDTADTAFGKPPQAFQYSVAGKLVTFGTSIYTLSADGNTMTAQKGSVVQGVVFTLEP